MVKTFSYKRMVAVFTLSFLLLLLLDGIPTYLLTVQDDYATRWVGGELVLQSPSVLPLPKEVEGEGVFVANSIKMSTMMLAGDDMHLVHLQLIDDAYPLLGEIQGIPPEGMKKDVVWLDETFAEDKGINVGDYVSIGQGTWRVDGFVVKQDEQIFSFEAFSPSVFMHYSQKDAVGLVVPTARLKHYTYIVADDVKPIQQRLAQSLSKDVRMINPDESLGRMERLLDRVVNLLYSTRLMGYLLAGFLIHMGVVHYHHCRAHDVGVMMALGGRRITRLVFLAKPLGKMSGKALLVGLVLGLVPVWSFVQLLGHSWMGVGDIVLRAVVIYGVLIVTLSVLHIVGILRMSTLALLRHQYRSMSELMMLLATACVGVYVVYAQWDLVGVVALILNVFCGLGLLYGAIYWVLQSVMKYLQNGGVRSLLLLNNLRLYRFEYVFVLLFMTGVMSSGLYLWHANSQIIPSVVAGLPEDTPNGFFVGISPGDLAQIQTRYEWLNKDLFYPIVKGRLTAVNGQSVSEFQDGMFINHEVFNRQINLTALEQLPQNNELLAGEWNGGGISAEAGIMQRLSLTGGDELTFLIYGKEVTLPITSARRVDWQSMRANFYFIFPPSVLQDFPTSYISNQYVSEERRGDVIQMVRDFPNITYLDTRVFVEQAQDLLSRLTYLLSGFLWVLGIFGVGAFLLLLEKQAVQKRQQIYAMSRLGLSLAQYPVLADELHCLVGLSTLLAATVGFGVVVWISALIFEVWQIDYRSAILLLLPWLFVWIYIRMTNGSRLREYGGYVA